MIIRFIWFVFLLSIPAFVFFRVVPIKTRKKILTEFKIAWYFLGGALLLALILWGVSAWVN
jgi:hypothetical protein